MKVTTYGLLDLQHSHFRTEAPLATWMQFERCFREAVRLLEQRLSAHGLTRTSANILIALQGQPGGVEIKTLLNATGILPAGISGALNRMERHGLCIRTSGGFGDDMRAKTVTLSEKGQKVLDAALSDYEEWSIDLIPTDQVAQLFRSAAVALSASV